jgi:hypothetical protein
MISFGIIKGFLKRVHVYPVWLDHPSFHEAEEAQRKATSALSRSRGRSAVTRPLSLDIAPAQKARLVETSKNMPERDPTPRPGTKNHLAGVGPGAHFDRPDYPASLPPLLDGDHSSDELCVRYRVSFRQLLDYLKAIGHLPQTNPPTPYTASTPGFVPDEADSDLGRVVLIHV